MVLSVLFGGVTRVTVGFALSNVIVLFELFHALFELLSTHRTFQINLPCGRLLSVMFVNPESKIDKKWIIYPATHNSICDASSLKTGLESMFAMVDEYTK